MSILLLGELGARALGFLPSVPQDGRHWVHLRSSVGEDDLVLLGSSRIRTAVRPSLMEELSGRRTFQLAAPGCPVLLFLRDLANDPGFSGLVIADVTPKLEFDASRQQDPVVRKEYLDPLEEWRSPADRFAFRLWLAASSRLSSMNRTWRQHVWRFLREGQKPNPKSRTTNAERWVRADFGDSDVRKVQESILKKMYRGVEVPNRGQLDDQIDALEREISRIQSRGGRVVLVRLPVSGAVRPAEEERFPRARFWDVLADRSTAETIHFADYPSLASFECAEGSHLGYEDVDDFTRALWRVVDGALTAR